MREQFLEHLIVLDDPPDTQARALFVPETVYLIFHQTGMLLLKMCPDLIQDNTLGQSFLANLVGYADIVSLFEFRSW